MNVNVVPQDVVLVPLYVGTESDLCLQKKTTLIDDGPVRYSKGGDLKSG